MAADGYFDSFVTMKRWMENRNDGKSLATYFAEHRYRSVGIYGAGDLGRLLWAELKGSSVRVEFFVDRNAESLGQIDGVPVVAMEEITKCAPVDGLIVTPLGIVDEICGELIAILPELPVISLRDAVYEL